MFTRCKASVNSLMTTARSATSGAIPKPVSSRLPKRELDAIVELANPKVIVGVDPAEHSGRACLAPGWEPAGDLDDRMLPDAVSEPFKAMTSGGSTGRPKLILAGSGGRIDPDAHPGLIYPVLLAAVGRCPPEDVGGPPGYEEFLAALSDPEHEAHAEMLEWCPGGFDPHAVDPLQIEQALQKTARRWTRKPNVKRP